MTFGEHLSARSIELLIGCVLLLAVASQAYAAPAPWYIWDSKTDDHQICRQSYPGEGWEKIAGPFTSAQCGRYLKELKTGSSIWQLEPKYLPRKP